MMLPKAREEGLELSVPTALVPVPDTAIVNVASDASDETVMLPLETPAEAGVN